MAGYSSSSHHHHPPSQGTGPTYGSFSHGQVAHDAYPSAPGHATPPEASPPPPPPLTSFQQYPASTAPASAAGTAAAAVGTASNPLAPAAATSQLQQQQQQPSTTTSTSSSSPAGATAPRVRRRNRMITSCLECRRRKLKCDKQSPCANCLKFARQCMFLAPALDSASQLKLTEIKEKQASLDRVLEQDVARNGAWREARRARTAAAVAAAQGGWEGEGMDGEDRDGGGDEFAGIPEDERDLEPTPLAIGDAVYEKGDDELEDELVDLGIAMGKMRLTDRIGGFFRPKMTEEMNVTLAKDDPNSLRAIQKAAYNRPANFMAPGPSYLPPSSGFFFASSTSGGSGRSLIDFLPSQHAADHLVKQYYHAVHPICRTVHWPSFRRRYDTFWNELRMGIEPVASLQALVFAAMFCAIVSTPEDVLFRDFAVPKKDLVENFQQGAEMALSRAQFLRTTKTETMQAFVMYLTPLCRDQMSRAHSALVGTAIRLAECMGLHRDGTAYGMSPVEVHVRRLIWYQLAVLDIRTCEAHGPRPAIRDGEFDTKVPLNVNDNDLEHPTNPPTQDSNEWTDMTATLIRIQCNEMHRVIWFDRPRIEKKQISLTSVLGKIENFKRIMHERYIPLLNRPDGQPTSNPLHIAARLMLTILISRMYVMVLHRYHNSVSARIPERLRSALRSAGADCIEAAMTFDTHPALTPWSWISGALQQYHAAFLLMAEVFQYPDGVETDRIWRVLDYVFEPPAGLTRNQRALVILKELRDRLELYHAARKSKAPVAMIRRLGAGSQKSPSPSSPPGAPGGNPADIDTAATNTTAGPASAFSSTSPVTGMTATASAAASDPVAAGGDVGRGLGGFQEEEEEEGKSLLFVGGPGGEIRRDELPASPLSGDDQMRSVGLATNTAAPVPVSSFPPPLQQKQQQQSGQGQVGQQGGGGGGYSQTPNTGLAAAFGLQGMNMTGLGGGDSSLAQKAAGFSPESLGSGTNVDDLMADIDWNEWDRLFPPSEFTSADTMANFMAPSS